MLLPNIPAAVVALPVAVNILEERFDQVPSLLCGNGVLRAGHETIQPAIFLGLFDAAVDMGNALFHNGLVVIHLIIIRGISLVLPRASLSALARSNSLDGSDFVSQSILQEAQLAGVQVDICAGHLKAMAVHTLCPEKTIDMVEEGDIVDGYRKLNVAGMAGT